MNRREQEELKRSFVFYEPWCRWHLDDCVQDESYVEWCRYPGNEGENVSHAWFALSANMSRNIACGDLFSLKFTDIRNGMRVEKRGTIQAIGDDPVDILNSHERLILFKFLDKSNIYLLSESDNVTIINIGLYASYKKQLDNLTKIVMKLAQDRLLSKVFMQNGRKLDHNELVSKNKINNATVVPEFHRDCNESQRDVIVQAINNRITLVKGPPGTGKTFTSAVLVHNLNRTKKKSSKILICTSSNVALDNIAIKILELYGDKLNVVRIRSLKAQQSNTTELVEQLYLDDILMSEKGEPFERYRLLLAEGYKRLGDLVRLEKSPELKELEEECERIILEKADVLCTTCSGASRLFRLFEESLEIDSLVIDECSQVALPEALLPVIFCPRRVVVVGDDRQLGVVIQDEVRSSFPQYSNECLSLFRLLKRRGLKSMLLDTQYRMHPLLVEFPNKMFYNNEIKNGIGPEDRKWPHVNIKSPFPKQDVPLYFHCHNHQENRRLDSKSVFNEREAEIVAETVRVLLSRGIKGGMIGVITPYRDQCKEIVVKLNKMREDFKNFISDKSKKARNSKARRKACRKKKNFITDSEHIEVATVDAYQGREKDYIILSMVRSLKGGYIGFVADKKRLNVSLTRARFGMVIIGNPLVLKRERLWELLLIHLSKKRLLYDKVLTETGKGMDLNTYERLHKDIATRGTFN